MSISNMSNEINNALKDAKEDPLRERRELLEGYITSMAHALEALGHKVEMDRVDRADVGGISNIRSVDNVSVSLTFLSHRAYVSSGYGLRTTGELVMRIEVSHSYTSRFVSKKGKLNIHKAANTLSKKVKGETAERLARESLQKKNQSAEAVRKELIAGYAGLVDQSGKYYCGNTLTGGPDTFTLHLSSLKVEHVTELLAFARDLGMLTEQ